MFGLPGATVSPFIYFADMSLMMHQPHLSPTNQFLTFSQIWLDSEVSEAKNCETSFLKDGCDQRELQKRRSGGLTGCRQEWRAGAVLPRLHVMRPWEDTPTHVRKRRSKVTARSCPLPPTGEEPGPPPDGAQSTLASSPQLGHSFTGSAATHPAVCAVFKDLGSQWEPGWS